MTVLAPIELPFELFVDGPPRTKGSVSRNATGRGVRHTAASKRWQNAIASRIVQERDQLRGRQLGAESVLEPVAVIAEFRLHPPRQSAPPWPSRRGDGDSDKLERCLGDALESGGLLGDDAQIVEWHVLERWTRGTERDGVRILVRHPHDQLVEFMILDQMAKLLGDLSTSRFTGILNTENMMVAPSYDPAIIRRDLRRMTSELNAVRPLLSRMTFDDMPIRRMEYYDPRPSGDNWLVEEFERATQRVEFYNTRATNESSANGSE